MDSGRDQPQVIPRNIIEEEMFLGDFALQSLEEMYQNLQKLNPIYSIIVVLMFFNHYTLLIETFNDR